MESLRTTVPGEVFDYQLLMDSLSGYKKPRDKVTRLLKSGEVIRVKKGLYCFGRHWRRGLVNPILLANLIYGPSYVSLEYALEWYGFIPEAVRTVTSVTTGRNKQFHTPLGWFTYQHLPLRAYPIGMEWVEAGRTGILIASPEKALADRLVQVRDIEDEDELLECLTEDLRIDETDIAGLRVTRLDAIAQAYGKPILRLLASTVRRLR